MNNPSAPPRGQLPWNAIFSAFTALLYGASPIDLIPDLFAPLGFIDDALVVPMLLILAFFQYKRAQKRNAGTQRSGVIVMPPIQKP